MRNPTRPTQPDTSPLHNVKQPRSSKTIRSGQPSLEDRQTFFYSRILCLALSPTKGRTAAANFFASHLDNGGAGRDRTDDLKLAKLPLSQLSYGPSFAPLRRREARANMRGARSRLRRLRRRYPILRHLKTKLIIRCQRHREAERPPRTSARQPRRRTSPPAFEASIKWWAWDDSNVRPHPYQGCALTT